LTVGWHFGFGFNIFKQPSESPIQNEWEVVKKFVGVWKETSKQPQTHEMGGFVRIG